MILRIVTILFFLIVAGETNPPACEVFCYGKILEVVQRSKLYTDDKTFVDMKMKFPLSEIHKKFDKMMKESNGKPSKIIVRRFVRRSFSPPGKDFVRQVPADWVDKPSFIYKIKDQRLTAWAKEIVYLWKRFGRKVSNDVRKNPNMYSILYVPNLAITPGGSKREYHYFDAFWIVLGLLRSEMFQTVKGMISNYLLLIETYGYVPRGGRIYFLTTSSQPLLISMVNEYYKSTNDTKFVIKTLNTLEKEFNFWLNNRTVEIEVNGKKYKFAKYSCESVSPRPHAYFYDITGAEVFKTTEEKQEYYRNLLTSCESGWIFSSRWFAYHKVQTGNLSDSTANYILPVDLNALISLNAQILSTFFKILKNDEKAAKYDNISSNFQKAVTEIMWDEKDGIWYDYDLKLKKLRKYFFASNVVPLWAGCYDKKEKDKFGFKVTNYLKSLNIEKFMGGIPTTLHTKRPEYRWDFPNVLPPMQYIIIMGLRMTENKDAEEYAFKLANNWIVAVYKGFLLTKEMHERYNAKEPGRPGHSKHKLSHTGYGWTNGICLELLFTYGASMKLDLYSGSCSPLPSIFINIIQILFLTFFLYY